MIVMIAAEMVSRNAFSKRRHIPRILVQPPLLLSIQHLLLLPFQGSVAFHLFVFLLQFAGW